MPSTSCTFLLLLFLAPAMAFGQVPDGEPAPEQSAAATQSHAGESVIRITIDNDIIAPHAGRPDDHDYTHGTRLLLSFAGVPGWAHRLTGNASACLSAEARRVGCIAGTLELGQEIYTPRIDGFEPVPGERPYTGWLYVSPGVHHISDTRVRSIRLLVGVTGPASLGEKAQDGIHSLLGEHERRGWRNQLRSEVGVAVAYDDRHVVERAVGGGVGAIALGWGAIAGNVRTALHFDALARIGLRSNRAWSPDELEVRTPMRLYAIAGFRQELVVRDLFVDGNTFHESVHAERIPVVRDFVLGFGMRREAFAMEYRWVQRGREYEAQPRAHAWGSLAFVFYRD